MTVTFCPAGYVLHERERSYHGDGIGWLSIKSFANGQAFYEVGQHRYAVDHERYLLLNHGQRYSIHIESKTPVESFCVFFAPGFAETVCQSLKSANDHLLDSLAVEHPLLFFEKSYPHDDTLTPLLRRLRLTVVTRSEELEEQFHELMGQLLQVHFNVYKEVESLSAARPATREELYRRVHYAKDYAEALFDTSVMLSDMAAVACLSPNHLLRTFKQVFHQTPHQFITAARLREAQHLLRTTDLSVTEICHAVGFESLGTFSALFSRHVTVSPSEYRRQIR